MTHTIIGASALIVGVAVMYAWFGLSLRLCISDSRVLAVIGTASLLAWFCAQVWMFAWLSLVVGRAMTGGAS